VGRYGPRHQSRCSVFNAATKSGFEGSGVTESERLFFACNAWDLGYMEIIIGGDCSRLMLKLQSKSCPNTSIGFVLDSILCLASRFIFCNFSHVKRLSNQVTHSPTHLHPFCSSCRKSIGDCPDHMTDMTYKTFVRIKFRININPLL